jgi:hypothetical protein
VTVEIKNACNNNSITTESFELNLPAPSNNNSADIQPCPS